MPSFFRVFFVLCWFLGFASDVSAFSRKTACAVRFHAEVDASASASTPESDPLSRPVLLTIPPTQISVVSSAALSERQVHSVYTYPVADGSWGALFLLDTSGRKILSQISSSKRGRSFVVFIGNHKLARQLPGDLLIDEIVLDGMLPIPKGLTYPEALLLQKHFKPLVPGAKPRFPVR